MTKQPISKLLDESALSNSILHVNEPVSFIKDILIAEISRERTNKKH